MRPHGALRFVLVTAAMAGSVWIARAIGARDRPDVEAVIAHVGDRVAAYYHRAQQLICLERSTVVPIASNWSLAGFARTVESELRVELPAADGEALPDPRVTRPSRRTDGRAPRRR